MTSPIQPRYISHTANAPIELARAPVAVVGGGATLQADGTAFLRLMPRDRVIVTARFRDLVGALPIQRDPLTLRFGDNGRPTPVLAVRMSYANSGVEMDLLPQAGRLTLCRDRRVRLREAVFHVLNFPEFFSLGEGSTDFEHSASGTRSRLGRVLFADGAWSIEIQALPGTSQLVKRLKAEGGSAITHVGRLARADGRPFTILAAERALRDLHQFLSFARGLWTAIFVSLESTQTAIPSMKTGGCACRLRGNPGAEGSMSITGSHWGKSIPALRRSCTMAILATPQPAPFIGICAAIAPAKGQGSIAAFFFRRRRWRGWLMPVSTRLGSRPPARRRSVSAARSGISTCLSPSRRRRRGFLLESDARHGRTAPMRFPKFAMSLCMPRAGWGFPWHPLFPRRAGPPSPNASSRPTGLYARPPSRALWRDARSP